LLQPWAKKGKKYRVLLAIGTNNAGPSIRGWRILKKRDHRKKGKEKIKERIRDAAEKDERHAQLREKKISWTRQKSIRKAKCTMWHGP